jgi:hypothetical protein
MFAVYEAIRQASTAEDRVTVYVFDEPERHLHPTAQREAARSLAALVREGASLIVATHAPAFLNEPIPHSRLVRLSRVDGTTRATPLDGGRLVAVEQHLAELGLTRADLIQLTRGVLLVEGEHDRLVVESFYGERLADAAIRVMTIRGAHNVPALLDADLLRELGVRVLLMLDETSERFVDDINRRRITVTRASTTPEKALAAVAPMLNDKAFPVIFIPLDLPDIVWTLPEKAARSLAPRLPGWKQATLDFRRTRKRMNPKDFLEAQYGLTVSLSTIAEMISFAKEHGLEPAPQLRDAIEVRVLSA